MVNVDIIGKAPILPMEYPFLVNVLQTMTSHAEFCVEQQPLLCSGLRVSRSRINENGEVEETESMPFPRERFVSIVTRAMETKLQVSIAAADGERIVREVPLFPVMLIDIPIIDDAAIVLTDIPDFEIKCDGANLGFAFTGELYEFVQQDVDEQEAAASAETDEEE